MKIGIFVPLHITAIQDVYMANCQSRFIERCSREFDVVSAMTIDHDATSKFDSINEISCALIDMRSADGYGIVQPTLAALDFMSIHKPDIILRITQDTQVIDFDSFVELINISSDGLVGGYDECDNIGNYLQEIDIVQEDKNYRFVQGNFVLASVNLWEYYKKIPVSVKHYCDDSLFSYVVEHETGNSPIFVGRWDEQKIWRHNRTRNIYYLESLFR